MASTKTIKSSGGDYTSLSAWEAGMQADLTGTGVAEAVCYPMSDTTGVVVNGWTTTANDYIYIRTDASARHAGKWDTDKYYISTTDTPGVIIYEDYVRTDGLQITTTSPTGNSRHLIKIEGSISPTNNDLRISNCILKGHRNTSYSQGGVYIDDPDAIVSCWNTIIYGLPVSGTNYSIGVYANCSSAKIYSTVVIGGYDCFYAQAGALTTKNCYGGGSAAEDYAKGSGTLAKTNCASEDASADDTGTGETQSNCIINKAIDTDTFVNVTAGSEDFHLAADGLSPLQGAGVDTSGDSAPLNFTTDIDGETRDATWDIGADAWVVSGYTLACEGGSYSLSGQAVSPLRAAKIDAASGSYAVTGQDAGAFYGRAIAAGAGTYALTGAATGLLRNALIDAGAGSYAITGTAIAALCGRVLAADAGTYALTGADVGLIRAALIAIESGAYGVTGADVTLVYTGGTAAYVLTAEGGTYAITGQAIGLLRDASIAAESGAYAVTGQAAGTLVARLLDAGAGAYEVTGSQAGLIRAAKLAAEAGAYTLTGQAAGTYHGRHLDAESGVYAISGETAALLRAARIGAEAGAYALTGADASLRYTYGVRSSFIVPVQPRNRIVAAQMRRRIVPVQLRNRIVEAKRSH